MTALLSSFSVISTTPIASCHTGIPLKAKAVVIGKGHVHDDRMPEHLKPCCIIVYHEEILLVLVVLFVFELEFHAEDTLRRILITAVSNTAILVGNPFVVIRDEEQTISSRFDYIADRLRLDEIQYGDACISNGAKEGSVPTRSNFSPPACFSSLPPQPAVTSAIASMAYI